MSTSLAADEDSLTDVVWLQTSFLGDLILTTAAMHLLRRERPRLRQHLITNAVGSAALADHPDLDSITEFRKRDRSFVKASQEVVRAMRALELRRETTVLLQPHLSYRSSLLAMRLGFARVTFSETRLPLFAERVDRVAVLHESQRVALLLTALGVSREAALAARPFLSEAPLATITDDGERLRQWHGRRPIVGLAPGSVWGTKRWEAASWRQLLVQLIEGTEAAFVMLGAKDEVPVVEHVLGNELDRDRVINLAGRTTLADLRFVFPKLSLLVSNDSSPIHYASAFGVPTIALFGATIPALGFGPLAPRSQTLGVELECRPCSDHGPKQCPLGHFQCMRHLTVERVARQVCAILKVTG